MQPLGKNIGGYFGEGIDIDEVVAATVRDAEMHGWDTDVFLDAPDCRLIALHRVFGRPKRRLYFSAGMHGDEPAGPLAAFRLFSDNIWPTDTEIWFCPCLNPTGFRANKRENHLGIDLNRDYRDLSQREVQAHVNWLQRQPKFDVAVCLHEDWESKGFYVYELNPDGFPSYAEKIIEAVKLVCPIDQSPIIEGREASGGMIRPDYAKLLERLDWPEAFYLMHHHTRMCYTLEAPSDYPLATRVASLTESVKVVLGQ